MIDNNPLDMENIKEQQYADDALLQHATKYADQRRGVEDGHVRQQHNKRWREVEVAQWGATWQPARNGEEKWTRGGGALQGGGGTSGEQEEVAVQQQQQCNN